jgi:ribosomal protein S27AE
MTLVDSKRICCKCGVEFSVQSVKGFNPKSKTSNEQELLDTCNACFSPENIQRTATVGGIEVFRRPIDVAHSCPRCGNSVQLLSTMNEFELYCPRCDIRFTFDDEVFHDAG